MILAPAPNPALIFVPTFFLQINPMAVKDLTLSVSLSSTHPYGLYTCPSLGHMGTKIYFQNWTNGLTSMTKLFMESALMHDLIIFSDFA